ncbi:hypothetical protein [uncultured Apibacter sp.]|uniref:hypothetical protein n=1 Tax=uncultured Apibacter sp. TaxID=1778616 RepID=UPI0025E93E4A|nr:hypothetical protein [uncultured Apibacter sp.]
MNFICLRFTSEIVSVSRWRFFIAKIVYLITDLRSAFVSLSSLLLKTNSMASTKGGAHQYSDLPLLLP